MLITKKSMLTGAVHSQEMNITREQLDRHERGELVQDVFPNLTTTEREFIISGVTSNEWKEAIKSMPTFRDIEKGEWPDGE